jgi:ZIP family zinc transporter
MDFPLACAALVLSTLFGCALGTVTRSFSHRFHDMTLAVSAGMMLGAAILGLILPALSHEAPLAACQTACGVFAGVGAASLLDRAVPHLHRLAGLDGAPSSRMRSALLFVAAIALHKFPEGLAAGVSLGAGRPAETLTVVASLALQNVPEAFVVIAPLLAIGVTRARTFVFALAIGAISLLGVFLGRTLVGVASFAAPFLLSLAGGAMFYIVSNEIIPETHHAYEKAATFALVAGFVAILLVGRFVAPV